MRHEFKPGKLLTVLTGLALAVLMALGFWQLDRLAWKTKLLTDIKKSQSGPTGELPRDLSLINKLEYKRVSITGSFTSYRNVCVFAQNSSGKLGIFTFSPIHLVDGSLVLMNMGWTENDLTGASREMEKGSQDLCPLTSHPGETLNANAVVRFSSPGNFVTPLPDVETYLWYSPDIHGMKAAYKYPNLRDFFLDSVRLEYGQDYLSKEPLMKSDLPNNHFGYALTWFGLAAALLLVYITFGFSRGRVEEDGKP